MTARIAAMMLLVGGAMASEVRAQSGAELFQRHCAACHSMEPALHKLGPSLGLLDARIAGDEPGFAYSEAMQASGLRWSAISLDGFLAGPAKFMPGNRMIVPGLPDAEARAELIRYLLSQ